MAAIYGVDIERIRSSDYERYVGFWLNRRRAIGKSAESVNQGLRFVVNPMFGKSMEQEWYENITETDSQAAFLRDLSVARAGE